MPPTEVASTADQAKALMATPDSMLVLPTHRLTLSLPMFTYHVFFSVRDDATVLEIATLIEAFAQSESAGNRLVDYRLEKFTNKASFADLPDYQFTALYRTLAEQEAALADMKTRFTQEPHVSLMRMTKDFRVAFSERMPA